MTPGGRGRARPVGVAFEPIRVLEIELGAPLPRLGRTRAPGEPAYPRARALVRLHGEPLGLLDVAVPPGGLTGEDLARLIWRDFAGEVNDHLRRDGLPPLGALSARGVTGVQGPRCLQERGRFLERAPLVSVIVATRDRAPSLPTVLDALLAQEYPHHEVIVVDNAPRNDATRELLRGRYGHDPRVRYVREDRPGLSNARNCGVRHARGEIVAVTDDDVRPDPGWLAELAWGFEAGENVGCVTGSILALRLDTAPQLWFEQYGGFNKGFTPRLFDLHHHRPGQATYPYAAGLFGSGANLAFRASALRAVGGFDPALGAGTPGMGGEELAIFVQVLACGFQIAYRPGALLYHAHHAEYAALRAQIFGYGAGLTAYLTKTVLDRPQRLFELLPKLPSGVAHALLRGSDKNRGKSADYPAELTRLELRGMLYGPLAYLKSRRHAGSRPARERTR